MATIPKALLDLLTNSKTAKFAESLKHSDLPTGWADDPEIVDLAAKAWQEAGTDSPFFKAYEKVMGPTSIGYHATGAKFNEFKYKPIKHGNKLGPGFYFGDNEMANHFLPERNGKIIEAYLASKNPYTPNVENHARVLENMFDATNTMRVKDGVPPLPESKRSSWYQGQRDDFAKKMKDFPRIANMQAIEFAADNQEILKALGFDSILSGKEKVMWDPRQIKSIHNRGTFNPADPNIMRSLAPLGVGTAAMTAALLGGGDEAKAAAINAALADPASREKAAAAGLPYDPPPTEPVVSPIDILVAPVGAGAGITNKLLAMALEAPVALGLDAGLSALGGLFGGGDRKKPGGW